jgi:hypothetical protein
MDSRERANVQESIRPIIIWESKVRNEEIDRMLQRELDRYEQTHLAEPAPTDDAVQAIH